MTRILGIATALAVAALASSGCGATGHYYKDMNLRYYPTSAEDADRPFVGIVVRKQAQPVEGMVRVERVLRGSPADDAGVRPGDDVVRFGAQAVRSAADLDGLLKPGSPVKATSRVELTVSRDGQQMVVPVNLRSHEEYGTLQKERLESLAAARASSLSIPFLIGYQRWEIDPATWEAYDGSRPREPVVLYREIDVLPVLFISLFRLETVPIMDSWRLKAVSWPLIFRSSGKHDDWRREALAGGESDFEVY